MRRCSRSRLPVGRAPRLAARTPPRRTRRTRLTHCTRLRHGQLQPPQCAQACLLDGVPSLPEQYQRRPALEAAHRDALLRTDDTMAITATTTGVSGPAGVGKSTTAAVLARDPQVQVQALQIWT